MKPLPLNATFQDVAMRIVWFEPPEQSLRNPVRFDELRQDLANAPPGITKPRSCAHRHANFPRPVCLTENSKKIPNGVSHALSGNCGNWGHRNAGVSRCSHEEF
ncbi:hypothetical protein TBK1r_01510 [Stieleria magnilauensis]|uniref:Uncharacterized protein n=1 Tax=Stieleria magnilauensis TaxID=2527963 RepID=A0ABX5XHB7_9BACT|nr:hypothetical protein TBK1r_01510 [Planctomycetes bacterium TBK1r]